MNKEHRAIIVHRAYGETEVLLFIDQKSFEGVCDFLESSNIGFDIASRVHTCLEGPKKRPIKKKLKIVKK